MAGDAFSPSPGLRPVAPWEEVALFFTIVKFSLAIGGNLLYFTIVKLRKSARWSFAREGFKMPELPDRPELRQPSAAPDRMATRFPESALSRRSLLGHGLGAAATAAALPMSGNSALAAPKPDGARTVRPTIDVHHHILPDFFWRETNESDNPVGGIKPPAWSKELMLSFMDEAGIDIAITSISTPGVHVGDDRRARSLARRVNEFAAKLIQEHPNRLGAFACLPLPDVDGALEELRYALDELNLDGALVFSNARGIYLGDERFVPLLDELERRRAVVFVHPNMSPDPTAHKLGLPDSLIDFTADTTRAVAQMHYLNRFARTPNVNYFFAHAGGTIPYLAGRFRIVDDMNVIPEAEVRGTAAETFRRLHWDTALAWRDPVLEMLRATVGLDQVLFGTDHPYIRRDLALAGANDLRRSAALNDAECKAILGANALRLFPRLAALQR
jgi:6-methylsalicylate decarboxylase